MPKCEGKKIMRLRLSGNQVGVIQGDRWDIFFRVDTVYNKVGIFWFAPKQPLGGWLKVPLPFQFEFEALSYARRNIGRLNVLEIFVETEDQLRQLGAQLGIHKDNWQLKGEISFEPPIYSLIEETIEAIPEFIKDLDSMQSKIYTEKSWNEARNLDWRGITEDINRYREIFSLKDLPEKFQEPYKKVQQDLTEYESNFGMHQSLEFVLNGNLENYLTSYKNLYRQYKAKTLTLEKISILLDDVKQLETEFNAFWQQIHDDREIQNLFQLYNDQSNDLQNSIRQLITKIQNEKQELEQAIQLKKQREAIEQVVLQQLSELTPGIQLLLTRISELTEIDRNLVEKAIIDVLEKSPDLGSYDKKAQVFIVGKNIPNTVNKVLKSYPEASFEELILSVKQEYNPSQQELYFLVTKLYKKVEIILRSLVKGTNEMNFLGGIHQAFELKIINNNEKDLLHHFRKLRNELIHAEREDFPSELILNINNIFQDLKRKS